jgi:hypothetical protein
MTPLEKLWSFPEYQGITPSLKMLPMFENLTVPIWEEI